MRKAATAERLAAPEGPDDEGRDPSASDFEALTTETDQEGAAEDFEACPRDGAWSADMETDDALGTAPQEEDEADEADAHCFDVQVRADCEGTPYAQADCQWFHFAMCGELVKGMRLRFRVLGFSRLKGLERSVARTRFITSGMRPVVRASDDDSWQLVAEECGLRHAADGSLALTFEHEVAADCLELRFAQCFPYPLRAIRHHLARVRRRLRAAGCYVHREKVAESLGGRPVELLTITGAAARMSFRQPPLDGLPPGGQRPHSFPGRRAVFISARVHPGETPASHVLEGLLEFLATGCPAAELLLDSYVFYIMPVLNPDGVELGHHRTDTRGENLNRVYEKATLEAHPSVVAAEAVCASAHKHQGGLRLYLDIHAHTSRRGGFLLGDASSTRGQVASRLFSYALARRCGLMEYAQCNFKDSVAGTGKTSAVVKTGAQLCFTLEVNYGRGHHGYDSFGLPEYREVGRSCLQALLDLDALDAPAGQLPFGLAPLVPKELLKDLRHALRWLEGDARGERQGKLQLVGPSRARPYFAKVRGQEAGHAPSDALRDRPDLIGQTVEIVERQLSEETCDEQPARCRLHECHGGLWLPETDLALRSVQKGSFFYGALQRVRVGRDPVASKIGSWEVPTGTVLEVEERRVAGGTLRLKIAPTSPSPFKSGWVSEYRNTCFDPRLGGTVQLMRLKDPLPRCRRGY